MRRVVCVANTLKVEGSMLAVQPICGNHAGCVTPFSNLELSLQPLQEFEFPTACWGADRGQPERGSEVGAVRGTLWCAIRILLFLGLWKHHGLSSRNWNWNSWGVCFFLTEQGLLTQCVCSTLYYLRVKSREISMTPHNVSKTKIV